MSTTHLAQPTSTMTARRAPREVWTGVAFPILFIASVVASNTPADNASASTWVSDYSGHSNQIGHLATGILLVLAGLCLASFFTAQWRRIRDVTPSISPLPLIAAAVAASSIAAGGVVMAYISGGELTGKYPLPSVDVLRLSNDLGFALVGVAGMLSAALAVICLSVQGRAAGLVGRKTFVFGVVVAICLLAAFAFVPVIALLIWAPVVAVQWLRS